MNYFNNRKLRKLLRITNICAISTMFIQVPVQAMMGRAFRIVVGVGIRSATGGGYSVSRGITGNSGANGGGSRTPALLAGQL